jgi:hypothetical protein
MNRFAIILCMAAALTGVPAGAATLQLNPPDISGVAGEVIGWDVTIENDTNYVIVESSIFCTGPYSDSCANPLGVYTDLIGPAFVFVGPSNSPVGPTPVGTFEINAGASVGDTVSGTIFITYSLYSRSPEDPDFNPIDDRIEVDPAYLSAAASVTVVDQTPIPEPATSALFGVGLSAVALFVRRRKRNL